MTVNEEQPFRLTGHDISRIKNKHCLKCNVLFKEGDLVKRFGARGTKYVHVGCWIVY